VKTFSPASVQGRLQVPARERPIAPPAGLDSESEAWLRDLRSGGASGADAHVRLHALLLRAARFEASRRRSGHPYLGAEELEEIANEAADDALMSILRKLDEFRGLSRFTTWAYKFALYEAAVKMRRRAWRGRQVPLEPERWERFESTSLGPEADVEQRERLASIKTAISESLTPHQRRVLVALALDGVPIDVLAERLSTTRGALYKTLHDARAKLRRELEDQL
jgi:RNA polymerase sigma-70 factor, ECF subfamily